MKLISEKFREIDDEQLSGLGTGLMFLAGITFVLQGLLNQGSNIVITGSALIMTASSILLLYTARNQED